MTDEELKRMTMRNKMFPLLILMGSKKIWIKDETAFAVAKELQFETYLGRYVPDISPDWQWKLILTGRLQKKSGKNRQRDFFSVSHREIPHWAGHKIWYPRAHSAFAQKNTSWSYMTYDNRNDNANKNMNEQMKFDISPLHTTHFKISIGQ